jgi:hypothetical protein
MYIKTPDFRRAAHFFAELRKGLPFRDAQED